MSGSVVAAWRPAPSCTGLPVAPASWPPRSFLWLVTNEADNFATPRVGAGVLFRDGAGRVLLVKPTYKNGWEIPGGYVERGESPPLGCGPRSG